MAQTFSVQNPCFFRCKEVGWCFLRGSDGGSSAFAPRGCSWCDMAKAPTGHVANQKGWAGEARGLDTKVRSCI